jgi:GDP-4-dehydro-6-deoxy-D-mannose reductase
VTTGRIWITGGRGFAGSYLAEELSRRGHEVVILDRRPPEPSETHESLDLDLAAVDQVRAALDANSPAAIVHLAAQSSGAASFVRPGETLRNNLDSTLGLLEALRHQAGRRTRLIAVGSCEEYGAPLSAAELPLTESQALRPANPYAVSKAAQTLLCQQYRRAHGLELLCTRSFTHTGPGQRPDFVWSSFAQQIAQLENEGGGTLSVGNLNPSRDLSDVRDITRAYADLLDADWEHSVVNVCSGREIIVGDALKLLLSAARCEIDVVPDATRMRPHDVPRFVGDPTRLERMIGWVPSLPIETTLGDLLSYWRTRVAAPS